MPDDIPNLSLRLVILAATLCLSSFFSGSETALFFFQPDELSRMRSGSRLDRAVAALRDRPKRLLTTVLFGNMVVNVVFYSVSFLVALSLRPRVGASGAVALGLGSLLAVLLFGEVVPKNLAVIFHRPFGRAAAVPLLVLERALLVIVAPLGKVGEFAASLLGGRHAPAVQADELQMLANLGAREGLVDAGAGRMIAEVIEMSDVRVRELMVPRVEMVRCDLESSRQDMLALFRREKLTTIPVYEGGVDEMRGVVHVKDLLFREPGVALCDIVRPVPFLPETATVEEALHQCRNEASKTAFVVDEYGSVVGLITIEDLLEEIVGEITDEYDREERPEIELLDDGRLRVRGRLALRQWQELLGVPLPDVDVDTVGGLVMALLERVPRVGDVVRCDGVEFVVEQVSGRRAEVLAVTLHARERRREADGA